MTVKFHTTNEEHHPTTQHFPVTHDQDSTSEPPHSTTEKHVPTTTHHSTQSSEGVTSTSQLPRNEQTTTDADANADSSSGGQHGPGVAVIAGVSVTVVVLVLLAAAVITAVVVYLVRKKMAPQSKGFAKLSMTNLQESNAVDNYYS